MPTSHHIVISDKEGALPYSKGLMASSMMAAGLPPGEAFRVAELVEDRLRSEGTTEITRQGLLDLAECMLRDHAGSQYADAYVQWHTIKKLDRPLVILLGGATGVGKSTIAAQVGSRLGINRVIPTDAIREVMRAMLEDELAPALHTSSFDADRLVGHALPRDSDPLLIGFREQAVMVGVGIRALVRRAVTERTPLIVEGVHVVPGILDVTEFQRSAVVTQLLVTIPDEELHRSHFQIRGQEMSERPVERYLAYFDQIRAIQRYLVTLANEQQMPVLESYDLDSTLSQILERVVGEAVRAIPSDGSDNDSSQGPEGSTGEPPLSSVQGSHQ